jgi:hypothetical protein
MGLKDVSKVAANAVKREDLREAAISMPNPPTDASRQFSQQATDLSRRIKPRTSEPDDVSGHRGFKFDSKNPFHKDLLNHLYENGTVGDLTFHEDGTLSLPNKVAYSEENAKKFEIATKTGGGKVSFPNKPSTAVTPAPRASEKDSKRPGTRPGKTVLETVGDALLAGAPLNVDQQRAQKRREMEARQAKISETIRRKREGK